MPAFLTCRAKTQQTGGGGQRQRLQRLRGQAVEGASTNGSQCLLEGG